MTSNAATGPEGFYVTVKDGTRTGVLLGPYTTKSDAEGNVKLGRQLAGQVNSRAIWYAYGVTRVVMQPGAELPSGKLNHLAAVSVS
jgi:hypothetical protein